MRYIYSLLILIFMAQLPVLSQDTVTITISQEDIMDKESRLKGKPSCDDHHVGVYDPSEHDEPHEKRIDKALSLVGKVVKSGFGLFLVVKGAYKVIKSIFRR